MYAEGDFVGKSGHAMSGRFTLEKVDGGFRMQTSDDFFFDAAAPGPAWALGDRDTAPFPALIDNSVWQVLDPFAPIEGPQDLIIPDLFPVVTAPAIITWCTIAQVPLGEGRIVRQ